MPYFSFSLRLRIGGLIMSDEIRSPSLDSSEPHLEPLIDMRPGSDCAAGERRRRQSQESDVATVAGREGNDAPRNSSGPTIVELDVPPSDAPRNSGGPHGCHVVIIDFAEKHGDPACHSAGAVERNTTIVDFNGRDNNCPEVRTYTAGSAITGSKPSVEMP